MNTTRRDALRKVGLAGALIAIPGLAGALVDRAEAGVCAVLPADPVFAAIGEARQAIGAYSACVRACFDYEDTFKNARKDMDWRERSAAWDSDLPANALEEARDAACDRLFAATATLCTTARPLTPAGVAALLEFALEGAAEYAFPDHIDVNGEEVEWQHAVMLVCFEAIQQAPFVDNSPLEWRE